MGRDDSADEPHAEAGPFGIGQVVRRTGLPEHTLRFYEREGLTPGPIRRDSSGRRVYTEEDLEWIEMVARLRVTRMPISGIRRYADLVRDGERTVERRAELLAQHEAEVRALIRELEDVLDFLRGKIAGYLGHDRDDAQDADPDGPGRAGERGTP